jgi:hypothetical protein
MLHSLQQGFVLGGSEGCGTGGEGFVLMGGMYVFDKRV